VANRCVFHAPARLDCSHDDFAAVDPMRAVKAALLRFSEFALCSRKTRMMRLAITNLLNTHILGRDTKFEGDSI